MRLSWWSREKWQRQWLGQVRGSWSHVNRSRVSGGKYPWRDGLGKGGMENHVKETPCSQDTRTGVVLPERKRVWRDRWRGKVKGWLFRRLATSQARKDGGGGAGPSAAWWSLTRGTGPELRGGLVLSHRTLWGPSSLSRPTPPPPTPGWVFTSGPYFHLGFLPPTCLC